MFYSVGKIPVCDDETKQRNYSFDMDAYIENYLDAYHYAKEKGVFWGSFLTINFDGESAYHCRCCTPQNAPHITPDGYISACDMVVLGSEAYHMGLFIVGKWNENEKEFEFYEDKIKALNDRKNSLEIDRLLIEHPELRKYVYYGENVDENTENLDQLMSLIEFIVDATENIEVY